MDTEINVPVVGIDNKPKKKFKRKPKNLKPHFTPPGSNTGNFTTWERYPIGASRKEKPDPKKVVEDYLDHKFAEFPENKSYPFLADIGLAD